MKRFIAIGLIILVASAALAAVTVRAPAADRRDHTTIHNFNVEIDGVVVGGFKEVEGLHSTTEVIEYRDGNNNTVRIPGRTTYGPIVLSYGAGQTRMLWDWYQATIAGRPIPKDGSIVLLDEKGKEVVRYNFYDAWPVKWTGPTLDAGSKGMAIEKIEIVVERIEIK